jgi:hypothetical protein
MLKRFLPAFAVLLFALPAHAAITEADYLASAGKRFDAADANHNGKLDKEEKMSGYTGEDIPVSPATRELCEKSGKELEAYRDEQMAKSGAPYFAVPRAGFLDTVKVAFGQVDTDHNQSLSDAEIAAFDKRMAEDCAKMPQLLVQLRQMHAIKDNPNLTAQQKTQGVQGVDNNIKAMYPPPAPSAAPAVAPAVAPAPTMPTAAPASAPAPAAPPATK